ncbi:MAG: M20/M25/M40 family metallo-hydrolase, partial [Pseudomonadota bacterium]
MDVRGLPFDADQMLAGLRPWVECESPTFDRDAVNRMMDLASRELALMGARVDRIPGRMGLGDCVRARFPHPRADEPGVTIMGHLDTVHPVGTLEKLPFRRDGDKCYGPGICDMKGGDYLALEAIRQLARAGIETPLPITVLFTPDEEIGTPAARDLVEAEAARAKAVLVPEPGRPRGGVTSGRYAIARFNIATRGRPSHAGAKLSDGRSAIREMARRIVEIEEMTGPDCTFSVGVIHAGQWVNCVSSHAEAEVLTMAKRQEDLDRGVERMLDLAAPDAEVAFEVSRGATRPVWEPDEGTHRLLGIAKHFSQQIGSPFRHESSGGGSDGNFTG